MEQIKFYYLFDMLLKKAGVTQSNLLINTYMKCPFLIFI